MATHTRRMTTATTALETEDSLNLFIRIPRTTAATMNSIEMLAATPLVRFWSGSMVVPSKVSATMDAKAAMTRMRVR